MSQKRFIDNKFIGVLVLAAAIVLSTLASGTVSLNRRRERAERVFYEGERGDGIGIYYDLRQRGESAYNLLSLAERYELKDPSVQQEKDAREALQKAMDGEDIGEMYEANLALTSATDALYSALSECDLSEKDSSLAASQYQDMKSHSDIISRDGYNQSAKKFNSLLDGALAAPIASVSGIEKLDIFG